MRLDGAGEVRRVLADDRARGRGTHLALDVTGVDEARWVGLHDDRLDARLGERASGRATALCSIDPTTTRSPGSSCP
jgi:hypothetical protein